MSSLGLYAGRRRKKPAQRSQNAKSNPSKRHRDRLNTEMERLATLLPFPQDVISKLDKLSILRLSVSYLRAKNYFHGIVQKLFNFVSLQALNGFVIVVTSDGLVFYVSHTIQDYLGFHQCDVIQQSIYELVHKDDREELRRNLHWAMNPQSTSIPSGEPEAGLPVTTYVPQQLPLENSSFLERQFVCRFRCLLDNSSGFLLLQIQGRLKFLRGQSRHTEDKGQASLQFALFALATPLQPPSILEIRTRNMIFRTKHKLDFTPLSCDAKHKLTSREAAMSRRIMHIKSHPVTSADMMKTGETGLTFFRLLTKNNCWAWVQANARLVYKNGQPDYIIATQRPVSNEEGEEQLRKRIRQFPFALTSGEALLYEGSEMQIGLESCNHSPKNHTIDPSSLLGAMMQQDHSIYVHPAAIEAKLSISHEMLGFSSSSVSSCVSPQDWQSPRSMEKSLLIKQESLVNENLDSSAVIPDKLCEVLEILGLKSEDVENLHDNQFMQVSDFSDELLSNDDILSYIQDSLMKSDSLFLPGTNLPDVSMQELEASLGQSKLAEGPTQVEVLHESKSLAGPTASIAQIPQDEHFVEQNTFWSDTQFETKQCNPANVNPSIPTNTTAYNGNQQCVKGQSGNIPQVIAMQGPFLPPHYGSYQINNPAEHSKAMYFATE
uniref:Aryl hydrocarbon receptor n=1 Tax=Eptatretus burgeri TaxID=7764 RepID=A0A8C4NEN4_EPTBU